MKTKFYLAAAIASFLFVSCSSDDSNDGGDNTPVNFNIPLSNGKYWTYDVIGDAGTFRDSLYIKGDSLIGSTTYKRFEVRNNIASGFYSSSLRNNGVRELDNKLLLTGALSVASGEVLPIGLDLTLTDFIIFKKNAATGEVLSTKTGVIQQDFNTFPLTINYTLKSIGGESIANYTSPNNDTYTNVKTAKIVLNASVTTSFPGVPVPIPVLSSQDILVSTQYIASGIGVVYTETVSSYTMPQAIADQIGVPPSGSETQEEFLDTHN